MPTNNISDILERGMFALQASGTAGTVIATAGTISMHEVGVARVAPAAPVTGIILAPGDYDGQLGVVENTAAFANSLTFDVAGTSNVAGGVSEIIPGGCQKLYQWNATSGRWVAMTSVQAAFVNAGAITTGSTLTVPAALYSEIYCTPAGAVTGIILSAGVLEGQEVTIVNNSAFSITPAAAGTSHVADGAQAIATLTARTYIWSVVGALWFREA